METKLRQLLLHSLVHVILHSKYIAVFENLLYFKILLKSRDQLFGQMFTWDSKYLLFHSREDNLSEALVLLTRS